MALHEPYTLIQIWRGDAGFLSDLSILVVHDSPKRALEAAMFKTVSLLYVNSETGVATIADLSVTLEEAFEREIVSRDLFAYSQPCWQRQKGIIHLLPLE